MLGKVVLTKVDADAPGTVLPGAVFKLEEQAADGSWVEVPGYESLVTDGSGLIEVERLAMGAYRFVEVSAPEATSWRRRRWSSRWPRTRPGWRWP